MQCLAEAVTNSQECGANTVTHIRRFEAVYFNVHVSSMLNIFKYAVMVEISLI